MTLIPLSIEFACANLGSVYLSQIYRGGDENLAPKDAFHVCSGLFAVREVPVPWQFGMIEYLNGELERASQNLSAALAQKNELNKLLILDKLLTLAPMAWQDDPVRADFAVNLADQSHHNSPLGYLKLLEFYLSQIRAGETTDWEKAKMVARLAGETDLVGFVPKVSRAKAWFHLGELSKNRSDASETLAAYQGAIEADPQDESGGYTWMSAWQIANIYIEQEDWANARNILDYAETLPDRYHRHSHTRLRLAQLEAELGAAEQAIKILEETIERDRAFIPTRLYLASLYIAADRLQAAREQYQAILNLEPNHAEAQGALEKLKKP